LLFLLGSAVPARAEPVSYAQTFGYTQARNREGLVSGKLLVPAWFHNGGRSFSQPLLFSGQAWGFAPERGDPDAALAVTVEKSTLYGFKFPPGTLQPSFVRGELPPLWAQSLSAITKSHPTLVKWDGRWYIFAGTESQYLDIFDVTDFKHPQLVRRAKTVHATDIVSAPTVFNWRGHMAVVYTCGNTGNVSVMFDPLNDATRAVAVISLGPGRTSSSPAPVLKNGPGLYDYAGFAVGRDQGPNDGKLYVIRFDDRFTIKDGKVVPKPPQERKFYAVEDLPAGLVASFSVSDDGNVIYFGDRRCHFYAYDVANRKFLWKNMNSPVAGMFSNRSPALTSTQVFFPAGTKPGQKGALIALDRASGREIWTYRCESTVHTAPVVLRAPDGTAAVAIGTATRDYGFIGLFDAGTGEKLSYAKVCTAGAPDRYATGVSGELSFTGFWGMSTDSQGSVGWFLVPYLDFEAVRIDPGVPEGQEAKYGETYTATVEFGSRFDTWFTGLAEVGIDADVNGQPVALTDESGNELPKVSFNGKQFYVLRPVPRGDSKWTVKFRWTAKAAPGTGSAVLRAWINVEMGRISATWPESDGASPADPKNNLVRAEVPIEGIDLYVTDFHVTTDPVRSCYQATASVLAGMRDGSRPMTTELCFYGPDGVQKRTVTLVEGEPPVPHSFTFRAPCKTGTYSLRVTINEARAIEEIDYTNNEARCTYRVEGFPEDECYRPSNSWTVTYRCFQDECCHTDPETGEEDCDCCHAEDIDVTYSQRVKVTVNLDTGFGGVNKWFEGYPWAQPFGKYGNEIRDKHRTKSGYIVYLDVTTDYWTDWEKKIPRCGCGDPRPRSYSGKVPEGPNEVEVRFPFPVYVGADRELTYRVFLKPDNPRGSWHNTWRLPPCTGYLGADKPYPVFVPHLDTPDGDYEITVIVHEHGYRHTAGDGFKTAALPVCDTIKVPIKIRGVMWDDFAPGVD